MANTTTLGTTAPFFSFNFVSRSVRVQLDSDKQPWFNAGDVCEALEFANPRKAVSDHVDTEDVTKRDTLTAGGRQRQNHINESGLYALIFGSTKPVAKKFKRWVTAEVLPAIRKTGAYALPQPRRVAPNPALVNATHVTRIEGELAYTAKYMRHTRGAYNKLLRHLLHTFGLPSLHVLPADRVEEASSWLHGLRLHIIEHDICLEGFEARFLAQLLAAPQLPLALEADPQA